MSNEEAIANLVGLMTSFHLEIRALPDDLKCAKCNSALKNACQMPCGCRFCRTCIDDVISRGDQFCPGGTQECGATPLSTAQRDCSANNRVLKLTVKCPFGGCPREFPLADLDGHLRACSRKNIDCPFRELGALPSEEMSVHLLQESRSHSEILIGTVANISRDVEMLKRELLMKYKRGAHIEYEMQSMKIENESIKKENKSIKDEMKSMKIENESIKREKEVLFDRVRELSEKLERDIAMVTAVTAAVASNRDEMEPVRDDIRSIREQFDRMKCQIKSIQIAARLEQLDDWLIEEDVSKTEWRGIIHTKTSGKFGFVRLFELSLHNLIDDRGNLFIWLLIWATPGDCLLQWPFRGAVTITVADRDRRQACVRATMQCEIKRPADNEYSVSHPFLFWHAALRCHGVQLERGLLISCCIGPGAGQ